MKKLIAATAITLVACAPAVAEEEVSAAEWCGSLHGLATDVMASRQSGVPMPEVMAIAEGLPAMESMTMVAFNRPRMRVEANKQAMITDFANDVYRICLEENK